MAPKSISAWLYSPARFLSNKASASSLKYFTPWVVLIGISIPNIRLSTLYTFPSTEALGSLKQIEAIVLAV